MNIKVIKMIIECIQLFLHMHSNLQRIFWIHIGYLLTSHQIVLDMDPGEVLQKSLL